MSMTEPLPLQNSSSVSIMDDPVDAAEASDIPDIDDIEDIEEWLP